MLALPTTSHHSLHFFPTFYPRDPAKDPLGKSLYLICENIRKIVAFQEKSDRSKIFFIESGIFPLLIASDKPGVTLLERENSCF